MNVTCPNCATVFRVDPAKVPEAGVRARCSVCSAVFGVHREGRMRQPASAAPAAVSAAPRRPVGSERPSTRAGAARRRLPHAPAAASPGPPAGRVAQRASRAARRRAERRAPGGADLGRSRLGPPRPGAPAADSAVAGGRRRPAALRPPLPPPRRRRPRRARSPRTRRRLRLGRPARSPAGR